MHLATRSALSFVVLRRSPAVASERPQGRARFDASTRSPHRARARTVLFTEFVVPHPDRTWDPCARALGGLPLVPASPAVFLGDALGLPVSALEQLDLIVPIVGALVDVRDVRARRRRST